MRTRSKYILLILFFAFKWPVMAEDGFFFSHLGVEDGLSQISVLKIFQDSEGYLWFGTRNGLNRYDGYEFKIYRNEANNINTLTDRFINDIKEDKNKNIWVATPNGFNCIEYVSGKVNRFYPMEIDSLSTSNISTLLFRHTDGNMYMLHGSNVFLCKSDISACLYKRLTPEKNSLNSIAQDTVSGDIYIGASNKELLVYSANWELKKRITPEDNILPNSSINSILIDTHGIWLGTEDAGIWYLDKLMENATCYNKSNSGLSNNTVRSLIFMNNDSILIGTFGGLNLLNKRDSQITPMSVNLEAQGGVSHYSIHSMLFDKDQTLWIGTYSAGINYHSPYYKQITYITPKMYTGIMGKGIEDKNGDLWFATEGRGLFHFDPKTHEQKVYPLIPLHHSSYERNIIKYILLSDDSDEILCTTHFGSVYSFSISRKSYTLLYDYGEYDIYSLYLDSRKRLWVPLMTKHGTIVVDKGKVINRFPVNGKERMFNQIAVINEVKDNLFLMGGFRDSLYLYDWNKGTMKNLTYSLPESIQKEKLGTISSILCDSATIWVSTTKSGVLKFGKDFQFIKQYLTLDGLSDSFITSMVIDKKGRLWVTTVNELFTLNKGADKFFSIQHSDVPKLEFTLRAGTISSDGMIYFPASQGVLALNPDKLQDNPTLPPLYITSVLTNDNVDVLSKTTKTDETDAASIKLNANQNNLIIRYTALNYIHSISNQYMYRMDGVDNNWHIVGNRREAYYNNLHPGTYTFRVKTANNDGLWNPQETVLYVTVLPPLYKTWWAYTIYVLIISLVIYQIYLYQRRKQELERDIYYRKLEQEHMKGLHEERLRMFNNFAHELRTPLTLIINPLEEVLQNISFSYEIKQTLFRMKKNTQRMLTLVNNLMDVQRYESGQFKLDKTQFDISALASEMVQSFQVLADRRQINFQYENDLGNNFLVRYDTTEIEKVFFNLLSNAIKFTPPLGRVTLSLRRASERDFKKEQTPGAFICVEVKDTGKGFAMEEKKKIFEPFYSFKNDLNKEIPGTGIGLNLSRSIVELHEGFIFAENIENKGSRFVVLLPDTEKQQDITNESDMLPASTTIIKTQSIINEADSLKKQTLLIVDNDSEICDYLKSQLSMDYNVLTANNGRKACEIIEKVRPHLIVSDVVMPEMNGIDLCRKIKETPETSSLPIILLTAKSSVSQIEEGLNVGADDYITKPFNISLLKARIRNILSAANKKTELINSVDLLQALGLNVNIDKDDFLIQYIDIVKENISNPEFDIACIYNKLGMSRAGFYRKVKVLTGLSPVDLIRNIRLEFGLRLLKETELNITEIAQRTGFNSRSYFTKSFRMVYGMSPTEFLKTPSKTDKVIS